MTIEQWHDVPTEHEKKWQEIFQSSRDGIDLSAPCPVCSSSTLHHWYDSPQPKPGFSVRGGLWEWCSECGCYVHYSALVPDWWVCDLEVETHKLAHNPETIEVARREQMKN